MAASKFSKGEAIRFGFEKAKQNWKFFIPVVLIAGLVNFSPRVGPQVNWVPGQVFDQAMIPTMLIGIILEVAYWILELIIGMGMIVIALKFVDGKKAQLGDLITTKPLLNYALASILYGLITILGFILLIIPGIIFTTRLQFYSYLIVEKNMKPIEALKKSWQITKSNTWQLFLFGILLGLIILAGALALVVGLFIAIPTTMIASAYVYRKLSIQ